MLALEVQSLNIPIHISQSVESIMGIGGVIR